ncbi:MAG TPA: hypothetical protein VE569_04585 [Acidimicrobiia bacterium]|nr:hypothetical protein [Acidimicrobiia bacterium]
MSEDQHPVDEFLRRYAGTTPEPDPADVAYARTRLRAAIEAEKNQARRRSWPVAAWGTALLAVLVGVAVVFYGGRTTPAAAAIEEIASIAEATDPLTVSDTQYVYIHSEVRTLGVVSREGLGDVPYPDSHLVYVASSARETWLGDEGTLQTRTTVHKPSFFDDADEETYYAAGLDQADQVGETITETFRDPTQEEWPTDRGQLDQAIRAAMATGRGLPETVEYLDIALDIIGESFATPELRATTLRLIGHLDDLQLAETGNESATFLIEYTDREAETRLTFTVDNHGYLQYEQILNLTADQQFGIPADTVIAETISDPPIETRTLDTP